MIHTEIEIAAPPEEVRKVFLDFDKIPEWTQGFIKSMEVVPKKQIVEAGDRLKVVLDFMTIEPNVVENSEGVFKWRGLWMLLFDGEHCFRFEPSQITPGSTRFVHSEEFFRLMYVLMQPAFGFDKTTISGFEGFNRDLKARVESGRR